MPIHMLSYLVCQLYVVLRWYQRYRILLGYPAPSASRISHDGTSTPSSTPFLWPLSWKFHGSYRLHAIRDMQVLQD